jgi:ankyrin repeat and LEM domain-containing protein 1
MKTSFIYLLIDPRESDNLPLQYKQMTNEDVWGKFISSIFYVGKGKRSRPYSHLYDAIKLFSMENNQVAERLENRKNQIIEKRVLYSNENLVGKSKCLGKPMQTKFQESKKLNKIIEIWKSQMGVVCLHIFNNIIPVEAYTREAAIIEAIDMVNLTNLKKGDYYGAARLFSMRQKRQLGIGLLHRAMNIYLAEGESQLMPFDLI